MGLLWLGGAGAARAQSACGAVISTGCSFEARDANNVPVDTLCVGKPVTFRPCPTRSRAIGVLYEVLRGVGTTPVGCSPTHPSPYYYVPTVNDIGYVTVSELSNENGGNPFYIRTFKVYDSAPPAFTIAPCTAPYAQVTVTDTKFHYYEVRVGPAGPVTPISPNQPTLVFVPAGSTTITVTGHYRIRNACDGVTTKALPPLAAPVRPLLTALTLAGPLPGGAAKLAVGNLPAGYRYTIQIDSTASGVFSYVDDVPAGSDTVRLPVAKAGCYRIYREDLCGRNPDYSDLICTLSLRGTTSRSRNQLLLRDAGSGTSYTVTRNGQPYRNVTPIAGGGGLEDADVQCNITYTYVVSARQPGGGVAVSNPVSITTKSSLPPPPPRLLASFNGRNVVELTPLLATLPAGDSLHYSRIAYRLITSLGTATNLRGPRDSVSIDTLRRYRPCYTVRLLDGCGNTSPESAPACPSLLSARSDGSGGISASLSWTAFGGPDPGQPAIYVVQRLAADGSVLSAQPVSGLSYLDQQPLPDRQTLRYRLQIGGAGLPAGVFSYSNIDGFTRPIVLTIPTAFTPNGDGLNDVLEVKGRFLHNYTFAVFDRNGQEVFRGSQRTDAWDGRIAGRAPALGTYVWSFQQASEDGQTFGAKGSVTILK